MVKQGITNFFKNLKYFFTPLGTLFLGLLLGLSVFIPGTVAAINGLVDGINEIAAGVNLDFNTLWEELRVEITALDWNNPFEAIRIMLSDSWINDVLTKSLNTILGSDFNTFTMQITKLIDTFTADIDALFAALVLFFALGFFVGFMLTKYLIRRNIARRSLGKWVLSSVAEDVITSALMVVVVVLYSLWKPSAIFSILLFVVISAVQSLTLAYVVYAYKKVKFTQVLSGRNVGLHILTSFLIMLLAAILTCLAVLINVLTGIFIGLAIFEIAFCVISINAEYFVREFVESNNSSVETKPVGN